MILLLLSFYLSFVLVAYMLPRILILSLRKRLIDPIDPRKIHTTTASRLGGVTFFPAIILSVWLTITLSNIFGFRLYISSTTILLTLALMALFLIGVYDDLLGVSYRKKFAVQLISSLLLIYSGTYFKTLNGFMGINEISPLIGIPLTLGFYIFVTNSINLIDGIDGLASMLSIMALMVYGTLIFVRGMVTESIIAAATIGALIPFCYTNIAGIKQRARSRIFMGDTGSLMIGAILGFMAVTIWNIPYTRASDTFAVMAYTMLLVPCFDVIRVMIHRFKSHCNIFMPDKNHIHHKFIAAGASTRQALLYIVVTNTIFVGINLALSTLLNITFILIIDITLWSTMHHFLSRKIENNRSNEKVNYTTATTHRD